MLSWIFIVVHWNNSLWIDIKRYIILNPRQPVFALNTVCLEEKQQIVIVVFPWTNQRSNQWSPPLIEPTRDQTNDLPDSLNQPEIKPMISPTHWTNQRSNQWSPRLIEPTRDQTNDLPDSLNQSEIKPMIYQTPWTNQRSNQWSTRLLEPTRDQTNDLPDSCQVC